MLFAIVSVNKSEENHKRFNEIIVMKSEIRTGIIIGLLYMERCGFDSFIYVKVFN